MVNVSSNPQPGSRVQLDIEVPATDVDRHFATAYRHVAERTKVPGFRPGKAPRHVIDRFVGRGTVIAEAIDHLVSAAYDAALDQVAILPIDQPEVDIDPDGVAEGQTVHFTATVAVRPDVSLGGYTDYPFSLESPLVTDEQVEGMFHIVVRGIQETAEELIAAGLSESFAVAYRTACFEVLDREMVRKVRGGMRASALLAASRTISTKRQPCQ